MSSWITVEYFGSYHCFVGSQEDFSNFRKQSLLDGAANMGEQSAIEQEDALIRKLRQARENGTLFSQSVKQILIFPIELF